MGQKTSGNPHLVSKTERTTRRSEEGARPRGNERTESMFAWFRETKRKEGPKKLGGKGLARKQTAAGGVIKKKEG